MSRKLLHFIIFLIILSSVFIVSSLCYNKKCLFDLTSTKMSNYISQNPITNSEFTSNPDATFNSEDNEHVTTIAFISDTHLNTAIFSKLKSSLDSEAPSLVIHTGDLSNFGTKTELSLARNDLQLLNYPYVAIPGDHDIAQSSSDSNFKNFFSLPSYTNLSGVNILFLHNYYNFTYFTNDYLQNFLDLIENSDIIVSSQPIFVPSDNIFSSKFMGSSEAFSDLNPTQIKNLQIYKSQRDAILEKIKRVPNSLLVISGDHHRSSTFKDSENDKVLYHILGSLSEFIYFGNNKVSQKSLQSNRYTIVEIFRNKKSNEIRFNLKEIEI